MTFLFSSVMDVCGFVNPVAASCKELYCSVFHQDLYPLLYEERKTLLPEVNVFKLHFPTTPAQTCANRETGESGYYRS